MPPARIDREPPSRPRTRFSGDKTLSCPRVVVGTTPANTIVIVLTPRIIAPPRFYRRACTKHGSFEYWPIHTIEKANNRALKRDTATEPVDLGSRYSPDIILDNVFSGCHKRDEQFFYKHKSRNLSYFSRLN